jgi:hypothetical protein
VVALGRAGVAVTVWPTRQVCARVQADVTADIAPHISLRRLSLDATLPLPAGSFDRAININVL